MQGETASVCNCLFFLQFCHKKWRGKLQENVYRNIAITRLLTPLFILQEVRNAHEEMQRLTSQLYSEVHSDLASDDDEAESKL